MAKKKMGYGLLIGMGTTTEAIKSHKAEMIRLDKELGESMKKKRIKF